MDEKGSWKECTATQRACPLEPAFVWTATANLAPLVTVKGCDSLVDNTGFCSWLLWGSVPAASGGGREVEQSLRLRWLAEAVCFPQALLPSRFLRWEAVEGQEQEAEAVLTYGGVCVRAIFRFDRFDRAASMRTRDFLRRRSNGTFDADGEWRVDYSGHMLFGLSRQGPVTHAELSTPLGIHIPTQINASWVFPDGTRFSSARFTIAKVTAE
ncbi:hypothetical protein D9Q98_009728 [Chlorella vulgaris]|uniref:Uncharacterized protein n=1 Tax=Chlorella vulgaris TaxID=3077 RepID=A0A9D4TEV0_CHLVU|nr:hypothetical protein D9Q98_009728 [Chlorella vulgaris]